MDDDKFTSIGEIANIEPPIENDFLRGLKKKGEEFTINYIPNNAVTRNLNVEFPNGTIYKDVPFKMSAFDAHILDMYKEMQSWPWYRKLWRKLRRKLQK